MTALAKIGWGAEFHLHDGTALVELAEVTAIPTPEPTNDIVDATHFKSAEAFREYIVGLVEAGQGEIGLNYAPGSATATKIQAARAAREPRAYKIVIPTATGTWEIQGNLIVVSVGKEIPIDDRMMLTVNVQFTGPETEAAGA